MKKSVMSIAIAALATASVTLAAQDPQRPATPQQPDNPQPPAMQTPNRATPATPSITITGCLKDEKDVPGLNPNVVERAGITEDYILTEVKMSPSSAVSGIGVSTRYEIEGIAEAELKKHVNHQVELTGQVVQPAAGVTDDAPDFRATSVKMLAATCAAK